jgi:MFS family permease
MMGVFFFLALYMQNILEYSALEAGVRFLPTTLVIMVVAPLSGRLADRIGPRWPIVAGLVLTAYSLFAFSRIDIETTFSDLMPAFLILGAGIGLTMSPMSTAAMNAVQQQKAGVASGVLSMFRMVGGTFGVAALGALFQSEASSRLASTLAGSGINKAQRGVVAEGLSTGSTASGELPPELAAEVSRAGHDAFIYAMSHSMRLSVAVAVFGVLVALVTIHDRELKQEAKGREVSPESLGVDPVAPS